MTGPRWPSASPAALADADALLIAHIVLRRVRHWRRPRPRGLDVLPVLPVFYGVASEGRRGLSHRPPGGALSMTSTLAGGGERSPLMRWASPT